MLCFYGLDQRCWKRWQGIAGECERQLAERAILPGNPGTILKDIDLLLDFVGLDGIVTQSRNASFPAETLAALKTRQLNTWPKTATIQYFAAPSSEMSDGLSNWR